MADPLRIYWDTCAWLALINEEEGRKPDVDAVYSLARSGQIELWSSTITVVEANRLESERHHTKPIPEGSLAVIDAILFQPFVKLVPVDIDIARRARRLVRETVGLRVKADAIHLASAMRWNIPTLHTYDNSDLTHLHGQMACDDGTSMTICYPEDPFEKGGLFGKGTVKDAG